MPCSCSKEAARATTDASPIFSGAGNPADWFDLYTLLGASSYYGHILYGKLTAQGALGTLTMTSGGSSSPMLFAAVVRPLTVASSVQPIVLGAKVW